MVCKKCGYQNSMGAQYCSGCGRKLSQEGGVNKKVMVIVAACLLLMGICTGHLFLSSHTSIDNIAQILPIEDGSVAVLYTDGTVKVSGNAHFSQEVSDWEGVTQLYYDHYSVFDGKPILAGLAEEVIFTTEEDIYYGWHSMEELHFSYKGIVGVNENGYVTVLYGDCEHIAEMLELENVKDLLYSDLLGGWGVLKKDGNVHIISDYSDPNKVYWNNVKELRSSGHALYVIKNDGTVAGEMEDTYSGLNDAVKIVHYNDWLFGISADGRLLTHNGGNIYTNTGDMMIDMPGSPYYGGEVDIRQYDQIEDIISFMGLILLNKDGTVDAISYEPEWNLDDWKDIEKIYAYYDLDWDYLTLYGIQRNGCVIRNQYDCGRGTQIVTERYLGWKLKEIYTGNRGVVGLTVDGKLVGDGIYEKADFSVFE